MSEVVVRASGLRKFYGEIKAVDGLDLEVRKGEVYSLLGPNGAGKTTTIEMLEGLRKQDGGEIEILGLDPWKDAHSMRKRVGIIPQDFNFIQRITPPEAIRYFATLFNSPDKSRELLEMVGLKKMEKTYFNNLSGGQKQKLGLCLALVNDPELLFLDEPTTGLDPQARRNMWDVIRNLKSEGRTILLTTHYLEEAEVLADRVGIVDHGKLIANGTPQEIIEVHGSGKALLVSGNEILAQKIRSATGLRCAVDNGNMSVEIKTNADIPGILEIVRNSGIELSTLQLREETLEDVFLKMVGRVEE